MADYGVNIAVAVKNTQAITKLSRDTDLLGQKIRNVNAALEEFGDLNGKTVVNSVANFNKELAEAAKNFNDVGLSSRNAADAARNFARAQDLANEALREQAALLAQVRNEGRSGTLRGGTQYGGPIGPGFGGFPATKPEDVSMPMLQGQRSAMRPQSPLPLFSALPDIKTTAQAGKIASDMEDVYASIVRLTEKANKEEAKKLQTLRQGTKEVEELAQKYRVINETQKTGKQLQLQIRRNILETKAAAAEEARIANQGLLDRLRNLEAIGAERREQFIQFNKEENEKYAIRMRELDFEDRLAKRREKNRNRAERGRRATSSALIGGAFPLLFGQGLGASFGGAVGGFGGGMIGGEFGFGLSLIGTQLGSMVDQLAQKAVDLGKALNPLTADTEAVLSAVGQADTEFALLVKELEAAGRSTEALQLATKELEKVVGEEGVEALRLFSEGVTGLQNDFTVFITQVTATVAAAINTLMNQTEYVQGVRQRMEIISEARKSEDPTIQNAIKKLDSLGADPKARVAQQERIVALVKQSEERERAAIRAVGIEEERKKTEIERNQVAQEARYLLAAQNKLAAAGNNLLDKTVVKAKEKVIEEQWLLEYRKEGITAQEKILADERKEGKLAELGRRVADAKAEAKAKEVKASERLVKKGNQLAEKEKKRVDAALTLEAQFARELKHRQAASRLEKDKNIISAQFEDRMRRIERINDKTLTKEAERLANQIRISDEAKAEADARLRSLRAANALKDSQAGFELQLKTLKANAPGQFAGVFGGSERIQFLEELRMQQELARFDRAIGAAKPEDRGNLEKERDQYKLYQEQIIEATVAQQQFNEALALTQPVTDSLFDSLMAVADGTKSAQEAFADFLRSIASMLADAAKQMIATYIAIGVARMFAGMGGGGGGEVDIHGENVTQVLGSGDLYNPANSVFARANGGAVGAGRPYLVGERGPELFVPGAQGNIVPNNAMGGANVTVNVDASGSSVQGDSQSASQLGKAIGAAVQAELIKQKRPGGLLTR